MRRRKVFVLFATNATYPLGAAAQQPVLPRTGLILATPYGPAQSGIVRSLADERYMAVKTTSIEQRCRRAVGGCPSSSANSSLDLTIVGLERTRILSRLSRRSSKRARARSFSSFKPMLYATALSIWSSRADASVDPVQIR